MKLAIIYIISHGKVKIEILNLTLKAVKGTNELLPRKANVDTELLHTVTPVGARHTTIQSTNVEGTYIPMPINTIILSMARRFGRQWPFD